VTVALPRAFAAQPALVPTPGFVTILAVAAHFTATVSAGVTIAACALAVTAASTIPTAVTAVTIASALVLPLRIPVLV
jgi:hypothetical protein